MNLKYIYFIFQNFHIFSFYITAISGIGEDKKFILRNTAHKVIKIILEKSSAFLLFFSLQK